ncbi:MAG: ABC transporter substrate-binding protein [Haloglomus sp.]
MVDKSDNHRLERRSFLKKAGAAGSTITLASFAGCAGGNNDSDGDGGGGGGGGGDETSESTETVSGGGSDTVEMDGFKVPSDSVVAESELNDDQSIPQLSLIVNPPKSQPNDHETSMYVTEEIAKLGIDTKVETMTWPAQSSKVWDGTDWDMTFWQMVGRPSRLDPDEFSVQMGHSDFQEGYNYYFWEDDTYDEKVMAQRKELDRNKRQQLVYDCQSIFHERGPSTFIMYPKKTIPWNSARWDGVVELNGMGAANMLTFSNMEPKGDRTELNIGYDDQLQALNPFDQSGEVDMIQHRMIWDRLAWPNENAKPSPRLATEFNWKDDTTLEVPIREGHKFHDGEPLTAEDVKFSYEIHQNYSTYFSGPVKPVNEINVLDDYTVEFKFDYHYAPFPMAAMGRIAIVPEHKWSDIIENKMDVESPMLYQEDTPLGSGPMKFVHWKKSEEVRLEKFEDHFDPIAYEARNTRIIPSVQTMLTQLENGTLDMLANYRGDKNVLKERVGKNDSLTMAATTTVGFKQISYNCDRPPFHIDGFRRAMSHRFDKDTIVNDIFDGWGAKAPNSLVSSALKFWHNDGLEPYEFSLQAAANELADAGFVWGKSDGKLYMPADKTELSSDDKP